MNIRKITLLTTLAVAVLTTPAMADGRGRGHDYDRVDTRRLVHAVTADRIISHLRALQFIANHNDGTRSLGTDGYSQSVAYVVNRMRRAHYDVRVQRFIANLWVENAPPAFDQVSPNAETYVPDTDFATFQYSGSGGVTGQIALAPGIILPPTPAPSSASGCDASLFPDMTGKIALIQRGTCNFEDKVANAAAAGAIGAIIFNEGQPGRTDVLSGSTLANPQPIPAIGITFALGDSLAGLVGAPVVVHIDVDATTTPVPTFNVLAEKRGRVRNQDVVVGAHLDSVPEGPGINDNGSGTATLLTIAEQMARLHIHPRNTVRFAFWGAEEEGLFGSTYYVDNLTQDQLDRIALNLNFDMLGSPNFARFVYDGDGTIGDPGPEGSDVIEHVFTRYFQKQRLASEPTEFDGRSDYLEFINAGIPAGGLFSGAEGIKTPAQQRKYGGVAGQPYDACYHQACDNIRNLSRRSLDQLGKAAAHSVLTFAMIRENIRPPAAAAARMVSAAATAEYRGPNRVR